LEVQEGILQLFGSMPKLAGRPAEATQESRGQRMSGNWHGRLVGGLVPRLEITESRRMRNYHAFYRCPSWGLLAIGTVPKSLAKSHVTNRHTEGRKACEYKSEDSRKRHMTDDGGIEKGLHACKNQGAAEGQNDTKPYASCNQDHFLLPEVFRCGRKMWLDRHNVSACHMVLRALRVPKLMLSASYVMAAG
jgi:hypothetical protein